MTDSFKHIPPMEKLERRRLPGCSFLIPRGAEVVTFDLDGTVSGRVVALLYGVTHRVDIRPVKDAAASAKTLAEEFFTQADQAYAEDNQAPTALAFKGGDAWRVKRRFIDGFEAPLILEAAYFQKGAVIYEVGYAALPADFNNGRWIFETVLSGFEIDG